MVELMVELMDSARCNRAPVSPVHGPAAGEHRGAGPADTRRRHSHSRQPPHPGRDDSRAHVYPRRRCVRCGRDRARLQCAVELGLLRRPAHRAGRGREGRDPPGLCEGEAHHPRDQIRGTDCRRTERGARQVQGTEGRSDPGEPVRSHPREARGGGTEGDAGRARPQVCHHHHRNPADPAGGGVDGDRPGPHQGGQPAALFPTHL